MNLKNIDGSLFSLEVADSIFNKHVHLQEHFHTSGKMSILALELEITTVC